MSDEPAPWAARDWLPEAVAARLLRLALEHARKARDEANREHWQRVAATCLRALHEVHA